MFLHLWLMRLGAQLTSCNTVIRGAVLEAVFRCRSMTDGFGLCVGPDSASLVLFRPRLDIECYFHLI